MANNPKMLFGVISVFFIFSTLLLQNVSAKTNESFSLSGNWKEGTRSISSTIPISAFINNSILSIQSSTKRSDIIIYILKDGEVLYEEMVPASKTDCITINLSEFGTGTFLIELQNQWNDRLLFHANIDAIL